MGKEVALLASVQMDLLETKASLPGLLVSEVQRAIDYGRYSGIEAEQSIIDLACTFLPIVQDALKGATVDERAAQFAIMRVQPWGIPDALRGSDGTASALFWESLHHDLADVPAEALAEGCRLARTDPDRRFFPTAGELLGYCHRSESWRELRSMMVGLERLTRAKPKREKVYASDDDWAAIRMKLAALEEKPGPAVPL